MVQLMFQSQSTQGASQLSDLMKDGCQLNPTLFLQLESDSEEVMRNVANAVHPLEPAPSQQPSASQPNSQYATCQMQW